MSLHQEEGVPVPC